MEISFLQVSSRQKRAAKAIKNNVTKPCLDGLDSKDPPSAHIIFERSINNRMSSFNYIFLNKMKPVYEGYACSCKRIISKLIFQTFKSL